MTYLGLSLTHPGTGFDADTLSVITMVLIGFLLNAVVEEFFYRRWLQIRWERVLGGVWPAIMVSSLTWASWHIAIQGTGDWVMDLANVVANQGITGLFLGLSRQRHRAMWPLLLVARADERQPARTAVTAAWSKPSTDSATSPKPPRPRTPTSRVRRVSARPPW